MSSRGVEDSACPVRDGGVHQRAEIHIDPLGGLRRAERPLEIVQTVDEPVEFLAAGNEILQASPAGARADPAVGEEIDLEGQRTDVLAKVMASTPIRRAASSWPIVDSDSSMG